MKRKSIFLAALLLLLSNPIYASGNNVVYDPSKSSVQSTIPNVTKEMFDPTFWCSKLDDANSIIMEQSDIEKYNAQMREQLPNVLFDLENQPLSWSKEDLSAMLEPSFPDYTVYLDGNEVSSTYFDNLKAQINLEGIKDTNPV